MFWGEDLLTNLFKTNFQLEMSKKLFKFKVSCLVSVCKFIDKIKSNSRPFLNNNSQFDKSFISPSFCLFAFIIILTGKGLLFAQACPSWSVVGNATAGPDGAVTLTTATSGQSGACWNTTPVTLSQGFTIVDNIFLGANTAGADGIAFVLQNDPRGLSAISGNGTPCGACLGYSGVFPVTPSVAFLVNTYKPTFGNGELEAEENGE